MIPTPSGRAVVVASLILSTTLACGASRISGTYVAHGAKFVQMLQLTQTDNGQISGVFSSVSLSGSGQISSDQSSITGEIDADQLTLNPASSLAQFFGAGGIAGQVRANAITLQTVANGVVSSTVFIRASAEEFKRYADQLRAEAAAIQLNMHLAESANHFHNTVRKAEEWIASAELHSKRIPAIEDRYRQIESKMQSLVAQERNTTDSLTRTQISLMVGHGDNAGGEADNEVNYLWNMEIELSGNELYQTFNKWDGDCGNPDDLRAREKLGASPEALARWESACKLAFAERDRFISIYKQVMAQRQELKVFQAKAREHRKALVVEAQRID